MKKKIIIIGAGGHSRSLIELIINSKKYIIFGIVGTKSDLGKDICGIKVKYLEKDLVLLRKKCIYAAIGVGQIKNYEPRQKIFKKLKRLNFKIPMIKSKFSYISKNSIIGEGTTIFNGANINANVKIGKNCIINSNALIEHDVIVGNDCHISTGSILNGNVKIGNSCFVGSGSVIREGIVIKNKQIIPIGSIIKK